MQGSTSGPFKLARKTTPFFGNVTSQNSCNNNIINSANTRAPPVKSPRTDRRGTSSINMEWLKSSVKLLESALRERNKQMEIQSREIEFLRKELRRKDDIMREYENIIRDREDMEKRELEILHQEIKSLRMDVMSKVITIREQENMIEQLENKAEKLMSIMPPPSIPRARAQGVSAEPKSLTRPPAENLRRFSKNERENRGDDVRHPNLLTSLPCWGL